MNLQTNLSFTISQVLKEVTEKNSTPFQSIWRIHRSKIQSFFFSGRRDIKY